MTTLSTTRVIKNESNAGRISKQVNFTLCGSCFWSASYLDGRGIERCPICKSDKVDSMPVAGNEMYSFDHDAKRGVIVDFIPMKASA
jgi:hypothetical protein